MRKYICMRKCYYARPGATRRLYSVDDIYEANDDEKVPSYFEPMLSPGEEAKLSEERKFVNMLERLDTYALIGYAKKEYNERFHPRTGKKKLIDKIVALREEGKQERSEIEQG